MRSGAGSAFTAHGGREGKLSKFIAAIPTSASKVLRLNMEDDYTGISTVLITNWARDKS